MVKMIKRPTDTDQNGSDRDRLPLSFAAIGFALYIGLEVGTAWPHLVVGGVGAAYFSVLLFALRHHRWRERIYSADRLVPPIAAVGSLIALVVLLFASLFGLL